REAFLHALFLKAVLEILVKYHRISVLASAARSGSRPLCAGARERRRARHHAPAAMHGGAVTTSRRPRAPRDPLLMRPSYKHRAVDPEAHHSRQDVLPCPIARPIQPAF